MSLILFIPFQQHTPHLSEVQTSHAVHHQFIQSLHLYRCLNTSARPYKEVFPKTDLTVMINDQDITVRTCLFATSYTSRSHSTPYSRSCLQNSDQSTSPNTSMPPFFRTDSSSWCALSLPFFFSYSHRFLPQTSLTGQVCQQQGCS